MEQQETCHVPVMEAEVIEALGAAKGGSFLDCTLGGGGHTAAILAANEDNTVTALDRDQRALDRAKQRFAVISGRISLVKGSFADAAVLLPDRKFDGVLADLGLSTDQLQEGRGFSFQDSDALDMRMDESEGMSAAELVNTFSEHDLYVVLKEGGVGPEARIVARAIVQARPITSAAQLARAVNTAPFRKRADKKTNPATVVFQAVRMAVNDELAQIESLMSALPKLLRAGGRAAVITFHSLEDKIVARTMRDWESGSTAPASWPGAERMPSLGRMAQRKALTPSEDEISRNPASRSAKLRTFIFH